MDFSRRWYVPLSRSNAHRLKLVFHDILCVVESQSDSSVIEMVKFLKKKQIFDIYPDLIVSGIATVKDLKREMSEKEKEL